MHEDSPLRKAYQDKNQSKRRKLLLANVNSQRDLIQYSMVSLKEEILFIMEELDIEKEKTRNLS